MAVRAACGDSRNEIFCGQGICWGEVVLENGCEDAAAVSFLCRRRVAGHADLWCVRSWEENHSAQFCESAVIFRRWSGALSVSA